MQIYTGKNAGRKIWVTEGQVLRIGRTERADFALMDDPHISSVHFSVECASGKAVLRDLESRNGTYINGNRIGGATLEHGDIVIAGKTHFQVSLISDESHTQQTNPGQPSLGQPGADILGVPGSLAGWATQPVPQRSLDFDHEVTQSIPPELLSGGTLSGDFETPPAAPASQHSGEDHSDPAPSDPASEPTRKNSASSSAIPNYPRLSSKSFRALRRHAGLSTFKPAKPAAKPTSAQPTVDAGPQFVPPVPPAASNARSVSPPNVASIPGGQGPALRYEAREAPSGMTYFCPRQVSRPPLNVADFIGQGRYLYAVVNFSKLPAEEQKSFYRDAISAGGVQISGTQLIIEKRDALAFGAVLQRTWGSDATIFLATREGQIDFISDVYRLADQLESPTALLKRLYSERPGDNKGLFQAVSAVLMEIDKGARWVVFKNDSEIRTWRTLGFPCPPELVG